MRIVLTGAAGFLGRETARELEARGHLVSRMMLPAPQREFSPHDIAADFLRPETYHDALRRFAPDALIHCGWQGVAARERDLIAQARNVPACAELAQAAVDAGAQLIIGIGSQAEYGRYDHPVREDEWCAPQSHYAIAKLAAGATMLRIARLNDLRGVWGRIFSLYGPGETAPTMLVYLARTLAEGRRPALTDCTQIWDFLHVRDAARAIADLAGTEAADGVFNIASGARPVLRDIVLQLRDMMAPGIEPDFGALPIGREQSTFLAGDIEKLVRVTGWQPLIPLHEGLQEIANEARARLRSDPAA